MLSSERRVGDSFFCSLHCSLSCVNQATLIIKRPAQSVMSCIHPIRSTYVWPTFIPLFFLQIFIVSSQHVTITSFSFSDVVAEVWVVGNFLENRCLGKCLSKNAKYEPFVFGKLKSKIKILSTQSKIFCFRILSKSVVIDGKIASLLAPSTFNSPRCCFSLRSTRNVTDTVP